MNGTADRTTGVGADDASHPANTRQRLQLEQANERFQKACLQLAQAKERLEVCTAEYDVAAEAVREAAAACQGLRRG